MQICCVFSFVSGLLFIVYRQCLFVGVSLGENQYACYLTATKMKHSVRNSTPG